MTSAIGTKLFAGLAVCSGLPKTTTTIQFDHVEVRDPASADTAEAATELQSPDGRVTIHFSLLTNGIPAYSVSYDHQPVILESHLGLLPHFLNGFKVENVSRSEHTGEWSPVYGERKTIPDNYREWVVDLA
ncbi:MAG TPA: glycoside hydrolase family 97 N-terminal domain-containing protein, partial [Verrucomicrobiae bacterium]|nr:glycoside hydrolase family 97 N-terminal domain-containing protein [Verrucomicrobiae bacterium]